MKRMVFKMMASSGNLAKNSMQNSMSEANEVVEQNPSVKKTEFKGTGTLRLTLCALVAVFLLTMVQQTAFAQSDKQYEKKLVETFNGNNFGWRTNFAVGANAKLKDGYYEISGKRPVFSPQPVIVEIFTNLLLDPQKDFKITVKLQVIELSGYSIFKVSFNAGSIILAISDSDWAAFCGALTGQGNLRTSRGDNITLTIQKENDTLSFFHNGSVLNTTKLQEEIKSTELAIGIKDIVKSASVRINEVVVEQ